MSRKFRKIIMVEIDKEKCKYLEDNFSSFSIDIEVICADVREVNYASLGKIDIITASPPCEDLCYLKNLNKNFSRRKGTIPLTLFTLELVKTLRPKTAFYENVYRLLLKKILEKHGWKTIRFDMSKIIPQKRIRLLGIWKT